MCKFFKKKKEKILIPVCNDFPDPKGEHPENARLATEWCPQHLGEYLRAHPPTQVCDKHHAPLPPEIPKCLWPYHKTHKVLVWTPDCLTNLIIQDNPDWQEKDAPRLYDAMAKQGPNALRSLAASLDGTSDWSFYKPWIGQDLKVVNPEYDEVVSRRLTMIKERDLTAIVCLTPYGGGDMIYSPDFPVYIRRMVRLLKPFLPNVIVETMNEPPVSATDAQGQIVSIALGEGFPPEYIQVADADCSALLEGIVKNQLGGKGLCCLHWYGTMTSIEAAWPKGWTKSPASMASMLIGRYPSNDGAQDGTGLGWWPDWRARRSSPGEIYDVLKWSLSHYNENTQQRESGRGFEHLSACGFQASGRPNLIEEIGGANAYQERTAFQTAHLDVFGKT